MEGLPCEVGDPKDNSMPDCYVHTRNEDTMENRKKWTKESIQNLHDWIINRSEATITSIYIEHCLFQGNTTEYSNDLWDILKQFTWQMNTYGIKVFVVKPNIKQ